MHEDAGIYSEVRWFEDFAEGQHYVFGAWAMTVDSMLDFARVYDPEPFHLDDSKARALPGVKAVLHHQNVARVRYASGGQSYPNPLPYDQVSFDDKVRFVGDRVAAVAAETIEIATEALGLIDVEYEVLPAVFDENEAIAEGAL